MAFASSSGRRAPAVPEGPLGFPASLFRVFLLSEAVPSALGCLRSRCYRYVATCVFEFVGGGGFSVRLRRCHLGPLQRVLLTKSEELSTCESVYLMLGQNMIHFSRINLVFKLSCSLRLGWKHERSSSGGRLRSWVGNQSDAGPPERAPCQRADLGLHCPRPSRITAVPVWPCGKDRFVKKALLFS